MAMKNLFQKIANLNKEIIIASVAIEEISNNYTCSMEEIAQRLSAPGAPANPSTVGTLYNQCQNNKNSLLRPYVDKISTAKGEISNINRQIQDIIATCNGTECSQLYQEFVNRMEAEGYVAR